MSGPFAFHRLEKLPPYVFAEVTELMLKARRAGEDIIDLGMGNPDLPTPDNVVAKIRETAANPRTHRYSSSRGIPKRLAASWTARALALDVACSRAPVYRTRPASSSGSNGGIGPPSFGRRSRRRVYWEKRWEGPWRRWCWGERG